MSTRHFAAYVMALLCGVTSCTRRAFAPSGINISSDGSDYTPTARLAVALRSLHPTDEFIDIVIDSGSLAVPGDAVGGDGGDMLNIYLTALIVTPVQRSKNAVLPNPWESIAASDSQLVIASIPHGARRALSPMRLRVPLPNGPAPADAWVVFRITGSVIPRTAKVLGKATDVPPQIERFRVYACANWNLDTRVSRQRSRVMNAWYLKAC